MTALVFELPLPVNTNSKGSHWAGRHYRRKAYWEQLDNLVTLKQNPGAPRAPWTRAEATVEMRTYRTADTDNCHARLKNVLDWLQTRGYIVNDRDLRYTLTTRTAPRDDLGITLTLREVA